MDKSTSANAVSPAELQALLAAIVSSSDDAIVSKDLNGTVQSWDAAAIRIVGYTAEEMIGKSITVLFPPDRLDEEAQIFERIQRGERVDHILTVRLHKDGRPIPVSVTTSPIHNEAGRVVGASTVCRDMSSNSTVETSMLRALARTKAPRWSSPPRWWSRTTPAKPRLCIRRRSRL